MLDSRAGALGLSVFVIACSTARSQPANAVREDAATVSQAPVVPEREERGSTDVPPPPPAITLVNGCPDDTVRIPAGTFRAGQTKGDTLSPLRKVTLTKPYCIDRLEVTVDDYHLCQARGACSVAHQGYGCNEGWEERGQHPINCVTWEQAAAYCAWRQKRLPTAAEWEFAARGRKSFAYPWGNRTPTRRRAWTSIDTGAQHTMEVGRLPAGNSPFGVMDMGGNVAEWVQDWSAYPYPAEDAVDPVGAEHAYRKVIKGSCWQDGLLGFAHLGYNGGGELDYNGEDVGLRCARDTRTRAP